MVHFLRAADRPHSTSRIVRFEGGAYGTDIAFFIVDTEPGKGPVLHTHPYPETWYVRSGRALFVAGDDQFEAGPGDIAVMPGQTPHKFTNIGAQQLVMFCVHAAGTMVQVDLE
jgi:mannose-6-phosphate isomerase-like protein (cupin superfamily)